MCFGDLQSCAAISTDLRLTSWVRLPAAELVISGRGDHYPALPLTKTHMALITRLAAHSGCGFSVLANDVWLYAPKGKAVRVNVMLGFTPSLSVGHMHRWTYLCEMSATCSSFHLAVVLYMKYWPYFLIMLIFPHTIDCYINFLMNTQEKMYKSVPSPVTVTFKNQFMKSCFFFFFSKGIKAPKKIKVITFGLARVQQVWSLELKLEFWE